MHRLLLVLALVAAPTVAAAEGRLVYANDDDWDWASPLGAETRTHLDMYGVMKWSALDWVESGLEDVRGLLVGTPPYDEELTLAELEAARGSHWSRVDARAGAIARAINGRSPPNVILMMRNLSTDPIPAFSARDLAALARFVARGGRVIVLDDWGVYGPVVSALGGVDRTADLPAAIADADVDALVESFAAVGDAETAAISRDGGGLPGRALRVRFGTPSPAIAR